MADNRKALVWGSSGGSRGRAISHHAVWLQKPIAPTAFVLSMPLRATQLSRLAAAALLMAGLELLSPATASAQIITDGEVLKKRCASFQLLNSSAGLACRGYIGAVADIMSDVSDVSAYGTN